MKRYVPVVLVAALTLAIFGGFVAKAEAHATQTKTCSGCHTSDAAVTISAVLVTNDGVNATYNIAVNNPYGQNAWAVFSGSTKVAGVAGSGSTAVVLPAGKTYTVFGVSGNGSGTEGFSSTSVSPPGGTAAPAAPALNATYPTATNSVTITWAAVSGATSYDYQVGTGAVVNTTGTSVTISGLAAGTTAFKLRAVNSGGASAYTSSSIVYTPPTIPAAPVLSPTYNTAGSSVTITWAAVSGATSYDYQVGAGAVVNTTGTSITITGLAVGTTALKVRSVNSAGASAYSSANIVYTLPATAPAMPSLNTTYTTTTGSVTISWTAVAGAASYDYQVGTGAVLSTTGTSVTISGLAVGTTAFKLRATNSVGSSAYRSANIVYTLPAPPSAPTLNTTYTTSNGTVTISWSAVAGATSYDYQVGAGSVVSTTSTSVTLSGLAVGTTPFKVRAVNAGGASTYASANVVNTVAAPAAPVLPAGYETPNGAVTVSWAAVPGATSYEYRINGGPVAAIAGTSAALSGLAVGTTTFEVRAVNAGGSSAFASTLISTIVPAPNPPALAAFYNTNNGSVTISWASVAGATSYEYQVETGAVVSTTQTSVTLSGLNLGSTAFALRAVGAGGTGWWTTSTVVFAPTDAAPVLSKPSVKASSKRRLTISGNMTGTLPPGSVVTISVYVKNPKNHKYRKYTYSAVWAVDGSGYSFVTRVRPPKVGKAYVVITSGGASARSRTFTLRK